MRKAVYESTKTGKPIMQCILQEENKDVLYDEMLKNVFSYARNWKIIVYKLFIFKCKAIVMRLWGGQYRLLYFFFFLKPAWR